MANRKQREDNRSTEDILREMNELSQSIDSSIADISSEPQRQAAPQATHKRGGAMKSLLNFFVSVEPGEDETQPEAEAAATSTAATPDAAPTAKATRVADLVAGEEPPTFDQFSSASGDDLAAKSLEEIYLEAGLGESPCSVDELEKLMENPALTNHPMSIKVVAVNLALSAKGVGTDVPIADAVRRDRALDAYQAMLDERARAAEERNSAQIQQLTREAEEYLKRKQQEMEALRAETAEAKRQSADFATRRQNEENRLAELISPFLEGKPSPVTVGTQGGDKK
jgi:phage host-nuclease inhibitor protein Gam